MDPKSNFAILKDGVSPEIGVSASETFQLNISMHYQINPF